MMNIFGFNLKKKNKNQLYEGSLDLRTSDMLNKSSTARPIELTIISSCSIYLFIKILRTKKHIV